MELNEMLCNYGGFQCPETGTEDAGVERCSACVKGMMILVSIISGIVFAIAGVLLFVNSLLTAPLAVIWTALGTALAYLFFLLLVPLFRSGCRRLSECICCHFGGLIFGIFGTIFSAVIGAAITLTAGDILSTVIVGLVFFFFAYLIVSTLFLIKCFLNCGD